MRATTRGTVLTVAIILLRLSLSQAQATDLVLTEQNNGETVAAVAQQGVIVQLHGNPSTGYAWLLTGTNGNSVSVTGPSIYVPDAVGGVGGGGTFSFPFLAAKGGTTTLSFSYEKPWDPNSLAQTFTVTITVTEPPLLSILRKKGEVLVSWPIAGSSGFYLEGNTTLASGWAALNALPIPDGLNYTVTLPPSGQLLFFRLRQ